MSAKENKYLKVGKGVILTELLDNFAVKSDEFFKDFPREITSGIRTKEQQMKIIIDKANYEHLPIAFIQGDADTKYPIDSVYAGKYMWEETWRKLLDKGYKINPPNTATYNFRVINVSTHIVPGNAVDIGAGNESDMNKIKGIVSDIQIAYPNLINSFCEEPINHCFHINVKEI